jgi:hypothetical protein
MTKMLLAVVFFLLAAFRLPARDMTYRLEYEIRGSAISRFLLFFPIRVYYESSAAVDLTAYRQPDGSVCFEFAGIPRPAFIIRTLGFAGKTLALLTATGDDDDGRIFSDKILVRWKKQEPDFAPRIKTSKMFPHHLAAGGPDSFAFKRDSSGQYEKFSVGLEPRYRNDPAKTGIYFNVFPILADLLKVLNHGFTPGHAGSHISSFPAEWLSEELDFSNDLNQVAALLEKAVKSMVTVKQEFPFRLHFHSSPGRGEEIEICGESFPDVALWKGFMIREVFRRVRLRPADRMLLQDEMWLGIRNSKGQGGYGRLQLKWIDTKEENQ